MTNRSAFPDKFELTPQIGVDFRFYYSDGSFVDVAQEIYICRVKLDKTGGGRFYDDVW